MREWEEAVEWMSGWRRTGGVVGHKWGGDSGELGKVVGHRVVVVVSRGEW